MKPIQSILIATLFSLSVPSLGAAERLMIPVETYRDKVQAAWLGQIVGNIYGLTYEFKFIEEAGPDSFPYGYGESLERVKAVDGAFSDDDTDIEYMYLLQMEQHGIEPTYKQLADAWKYHVRDRVWVANRNALTLMHAGYLPPVTGHRDYNPNWFQIDPQLVNEIWAVTAPGMLNYASEKSEWAARITNDDFGVEPTVHYAAMYAAAFFEDDIERLIDTGTAALPPGSRFAKTVEHMKRLYRRYPENWQAARQEMADAYYGEFDYNRGAWAAVDANLNGAAGILALLYGRGDFQHTLDMASAMGFDADNQAATMSGLLGIVKGTAGIPRELLYPLGDDAWEAPFNDRYVNVSRHDLPDASIRDIAKRTAQQGENIILANGGRSIRKDGIEYYEINTEARFEAALELVTAPILLAESGRPFSFQFYFGKQNETTRIELQGGTLPPGIRIENNRFEGVPSETGQYHLRVGVEHEGQNQVGLFTIRVHGANLALSASEVLTNESSTTDNIEVIRDGQKRGKTYYNRSPDGEPRVNYYGYRWEEPREISTLVFNPGLPEEFGGWFTSLRVQYQSEYGMWLNLPVRSLLPAMNFENSQWLKGAYIDHSLKIDPVTTTAIRIIGNAGGIEQDARNGGGQKFFSAISELAVYGD